MQLCFFFCETAIYKNTSQFKSYLSSCLWTSLSTFWFNPWPYLGTCTIPSKSRKWQWEGQNSFTFQSVIYETTLKFQVLLTYFVTLKIKYIAPVYPLQKKVVQNARKIQILTITTATVKFLFASYGFDLTWSCFYIGYLASTLLRKFQIHKYLKTMELG